MQNLIGIKFRGRLYIFREFFGKYYKATTV